MTRKSIPLSLIELCNAYFKKDKITIKSIHEIICKYYDVPLNKIFIKKDRENYIAIQVRQMAIYVSRLFRNDTTKIIGEYFKRNHTEVSHATKMVLSRMERSEAFKDGLIRVIQKINDQISSS